MTRTFRQLSTPETCGLYYKTHYDRKNYDASYDRISGVANYDASVVNYDTSVINYDATVVNYDTTVL